MRSFWWKLTYFLLGLIAAGISCVLLWLIKPEWLTINPKEDQTTDLEYTRILTINNELISWDNYLELDLNSDQFSDYRRDYSVGIQNNAEWVKNPWGILFHVTGYPHDDELLSPVYLYVFYPKENIAIAILYDKTPDDSVSGIEWRVDMKRENDTWDIIWIGQRFRCRRTLDRAWTKNLCP